MVSRRDLIKSAIGLSFVTSTGLSISANAAPIQSKQKLLIVFLRGAYDATSIIIPTYSDFYYKARPNISIAKPDTNNQKAALPLDENWSLHPALKESIYPLWQKSQLSFIPFAGTDDLSRSHFETQNTIELGQAINKKIDYNSGFMARLANEMETSIKPIAFSSNVPVIFSGSKSSIPNLDVSSINKSPFDERQKGLIEAMYQTHDASQLVPVAGVMEGFTVKQDAYKTIHDEMINASKGAVAPSGFALQAKHIANLMKTKYSLAFLDVGGWDTHIAQGNADGQLANKISDLGKGLASFVENSGDDWNNTTIVVISEFGRTFRENGDKGTDHGHGSVYWVLGGNINGGKIIGPQIKIAEDTLFQNRDLPVLTDYRIIIGNIIQKRYGLDTRQMSRIFPDINITNLGIV